MTRLLQTPIFRRQRPRFRRNQDGTATALGNLLDEGRTAKQPGAALGEELMRARVGGGGPTIQLPPPNRDGHRALLTGSRVLERARQE